MSVIVWIIGSCLKDIFLQNTSEGSGLDKGLFHAFDIADDFYLLVAVGSTSFTLTKLTPTLIIPDFIRLVDVDLLSITSTTLISILLITDLHRPAVVGSPLEELHRPCQHCYHQRPPIGKNFIGRPNKVRPTSMISDRQKPHRSSRQHNIKTTDRRSEYSTRSLTITWSSIRPKMLSIV